MHGLARGVRLYFAQRSVMRGGGRGVAMRSFDDLSLRARCAAGRRRHTEGLPQIKHRHTLQMLCDVSQARRVPGRFSPLRLCRVFCATAWTGRNVLRASNPLFLLMIRMFS